MKKLINDPRHVVPEMLEGLVRMYPDLTLLSGGMIVLRHGDASEVAIISGGGAGHEPAHAGYVGPGLLRAAVAGDVFTSPSTDAVLEAILAAAGPAGVLLVVKNYTGDRLNFGLAAELARAEGIAVEMVVVNDDVALANVSHHAGRRGIAGTVLIHKIAGAVAASGLDLHAVKAEVEDAIGALATMGVGLSSCTVPAAGRPNYVLEDTEIELGLGIHGEPGVCRLPMRPAAALVEEMLNRLIEALALKSGDRVALLVNNLGATPPSEMLIVSREALRILENAGIVVDRCWSGTFLTALDMAGCSVSLLRLNPSRLARLDAEASAPAWPGPACRPQPLRALLPPLTMDGHPVQAGGRENMQLKAAILAVAAALCDAEPTLTRMDQAVGDGDLGISLERGARAMLDDLKHYDLSNPAATLEALAGTLRRALGGTSGPLYAVFLLRAARELASAETDGLDSLRAWARAFEAGWKAISELGDARPGDRTMLDALAPAAAAFSDTVSAGGDGAQALRAATAAAIAGARSTVGMVPRRGRSSYLAGRVGDHPDPGAEAVAVWLAAVRDALSASN
jgi:ATP-dependent dihydroxyacetone kinase